MLKDGTKGIKLTGFFDNDWQFTKGDWAKPE